MKTFVFCTFERERLHKWDGAVKHKEVAYLANLHRHLFKFRVEIEVVHADREVEFIMFKHNMEAIVDSWGLEVGSCEMMCHDILSKLFAMYPKRAVKVSVSEDGENGAVVEYKL